MNHPSLLYPVLLAAFAATTAAMADDKPLKGDLAKIQGKWTSTWKTPLGYVFSRDYQFEGNSYRITIYLPREGEVELRGEFKLDESSRPHKAIDLIKRSEPNKDQLPDLPGIYAFEGDDTLKLCEAVLGQDRPAEFGPEPQANRGRNPPTLTLKRVKETAKAAP